MTERATPTIRRAAVTDASSLAELGARTFSGTFAADNRPEDMAAYLAAAFSPDRQAAELADSHTTCFVAEIDVVMIGYVQMRAGDAPAGVTNSKPVELVRIYVAQEWLGHGVGEALMRVCINEARQAGYETLWLGVWERNERAQAFYRKWGFRVVGVHIFHLGSDAQNDFIMERAL